MAGDDGGGERRWEGQLEETIATTDGVQNAEGCRIDRSGRTHPLRSPRRGHSFRCPRCARRFHGDRRALPRDQGRSRSRAGDCSGVDTAEDLNAVNERCQPIVVSHDMSWDKVQTGHIVCVTYRLG